MTVAPGQAGNCGAGLGILEIIGGSDYMNQELVKSDYAIIAGCWTPIDTGNSEVTADELVPVDPSPTEVIIQGHIWYRVLVLQQNHNKLHPLNIVRQISPQRYLKVTSRQRGVTEDVEVCDSRRV